ncbi:hypothetical protein TSUD_244330 [Trifolium subterraneum]|uniref:Reverse transcriptase zinc-binding domain-containing protein n=1 Tax=Trifolium subterraneum TaxID=3900 RepID=A0A2Z6P1Z4_TRISU|nr:hypothetical protein TSUD_244330 [Trifolium subterraneum]
MSFSALWQKWISESVCTATTSVLVNGSPTEEFLMESGLRQVAKYGEVAGRLAVGGRSGSTWWREVLRIRDGEGTVEEEWFAESIERRVGNGVNTFFWTDLWLGGVPLNVRVRGGWGGVAVTPSVVGVGGDVWGILCEGCVFSTYHNVVTTTGASDLIWHKQVLLKVSVLAWRLPTKDSLVACNIIPLVTLVFV